MTRRVYLALAALLGGACRFGGSDGDPPALLDVDAGRLVEDPDSNDEDDDSDDDREAPLDGRAPGGGAGDAKPEPRDSTAGDSGAAARNDATVARDGATQARPDASVASCDPPPDLACDPVSGEGCLPLMQCLADPSSSEPAAYCVLGGIQLDVTCTQDALSTDCPPQHTCVMGQCRKYCYCDADCDNGGACAEPSGEGSTRFRVCE